MRRTILPVAALLTLAALYPERGGAQDPATYSVVSPDGRPG